MRTKYILVIGFCMIFALKTAGKENKPFVGIVEKLGEQVPMDCEFYDETGNLKQLSNLINKPTFIVLVFYECTGICSPLLDEVAKVINKMDLEIGKDYQVLTLSFDETESPEIAAGKRENYINEIKKKINPDGWRFLTGDSSNIHRLTDAVGFYFQRNGHDWIHPTGLIMISPDGKIIRYLYGIQQLPLDLKLAVMEALQDRPGPSVAKILNICYTYDLESKHYVFNFVLISGFVIVGSVVVFAVVFILRPKKKKRRK